MITRIAAAGILDFSRAEPRDPRWWLRLMALADAIEDREIVEAHRLRLSVTNAYIAKGGHSAEGVEQLDGRVADECNAIGRLILPWIDSGPSDDSSAIDRLTAAWVRENGDPGDPEVQAKIAATVRYLEGAD